MSQSKQSTPDWLDEGDSPPRRQEVKLDTYAGSLRVAAAVG